MPQLILFTTLACHLCEEAKTILSAVNDTGSFKWTEVDIITDDNLVELYCARIPVVKNEAGAELDWPFDETALVNFLNP